MRKFIREQAEQRAKKLASELRRVRRAPNDEEAIHDLRVSVRRFVQCLRAFRDSFDTGESKKIRRKLKRLMQRCGDVRDRDIAIQLLAKAEVRDPTLVVELAADRVARQKKLVMELERWRGWRGRMKVKRTKGSPESFAERELPRMAQEWEEAGDQAAKSGSFETLHRFRIFSKRYRYTLELFPGTERRIEQMRKVQDHLGEINDCVATLELVRGHARAEHAIGELLTTRERAFQAFWKKRRTVGRDGTLHIAARRSGTA
jgi:CHAD domain-containing protein